MWSWCLSCKECQLRPFFLSYEFHMHFLVSTYFHENIFDVRFFSGRWRCIAMKRHFDYRFSSSAIRIKNVNSGKFCCVHQRSLSNLISKETNWNVRRRCIHAENKMKKMSIDRRQQRQKSNVKWQECFGESVNCTLRRTTTNGMNIFISIKETKKKYILKNPVENWKLILSQWHFVTSFCVRAFDCLISTLWYSHNGTSSENKSQNLRFLSKNRISNWKKAKFHTKTCATLMCAHAIFHRRKE